MARILDTPLPARHGGHRTEKYPFGEWFGEPNGDGAYPVMLLIQGEDYKSSHASIRSSIKQAADKRNLKVETRGHKVTDKTGKVTEEGLIIQASPAE